MRFVNSTLLLLMLSGSVTAQTTSALHLSDYVGTYADAPGHTLEIVDGDGLFAVLDDAKPAAPLGSGSVHHHHRPNSPVPPRREGQGDGVRTGWQVPSSCVHHRLARGRRAGPAASQSS